jgi:superfamily II DNA or RNA helicase
VTADHLQLRGYQQDAVQSVIRALTGQPRPSSPEGGVCLSPAVVMATGLGKTVTFADLIRRYLFDGGQGQVVVRVHREELALQAAQKIHSSVPGLDLGIVRGPKDETHARVIIASQPTLARPGRAERIRNAGLIIDDECHHAAAATWRDVRTRLGSNVPAVGFTATMQRQDSKGLGEVWEEIVFERNILWGIRNQWLCDVRGKRIQVPSLDLGGIRFGSGLEQHELGEAMQDADAGNAIAKAISEHAPARRGVVFAPTITTAQEFAEEIAGTGISIETIEGKMTARERQARYERFRSGETRWLSNCMVLTEGWDAPWADCAVIARKARGSLYPQIVGRVLRTFPGKHDALVMDVAGASEGQTLNSLADLSLDTPVKEGQSLGEAAADLWDDLDLDGADEGFWDQPRRVDGPLVVTDLDLFGQRESAWLQTERGTWFIACGDVIVFLWPKGDGLYTVGWTPSGPAVPATVLQDDVTQEMGMAWAEQFAADADGGAVQGGSWTKRKASWRRSGASHAQLRKLGQYGQTAPLGASAGLVSDMINVAIASRRLDV